MRKRQGGQPASDALRGETREQTVVLVSLFGAPFLPDYMVGNKGKYPQESRLFNYS